MRDFIFSNVFGRKKKKQMNGTRKDLLKQFDSPTKAVSEAPVPGRPPPLRWILPSPHQTMNKQNSSLQLKVCRRRVVKSEERITMALNCSQLTKKP